MPVILPAAGAMDWMYALTVQLVILPAAGAMDWMYALTVQLVILNKGKDLKTRFFTQVSWVQNDDEWFL